MKEPDVLTRMRLCECWEYSLNVQELKAVNNYIEELKKQNQKYKEVIDGARSLVNNVYNSLENADKPIKFYEELLDILNINEQN